MPFPRLVCSRAGCSQLRERCGEQYRALPPARSGSSTPDTSAGPACNSFDLEILGFHLQEADLLGISRPTLIKLLEQGLIPYETPGRHRRLRLSDVLAFQQMRRAEQQRALKDLAAESQELSLYDAGPEAFEAELSEARHKHA
jgi:excisionase family DNA binding protein